MINESEKKDGDIDIKLYRTYVECLNCGFGTSAYQGKEIISIKTGIPIDEMECPRCRCKRLVR